jgi:hypothetical protein
VVKEYVAALKALRKEKDKMKLSLSQRLIVFLSFTPFNANLLLQVFKNLTSCMTKLRVLVWYFPYFTENSIVDCRIKLNHEVIKKL